MNTTEPYSPIARANESDTPAASAGASAGRITRRNVCQRSAPSVAAASSTSCGSVSSTGCTLRTTNGSPMKVSATVMPSGVNATRMPCGASSAPIMPFCA